MLSSVYIISTSATINTVYCIRYDCASTSSIISLFILDLCDWINRHVNHIGDFIS